MNGLAALMAVVILSGFAYREFSAAKPSAVDLRKVPPLAPGGTVIVPGVYMLGGLFPSAAYVVSTAEGPVLIDTGLESDLGRLKAQMAGLGLDWKGLRAILLTHVHVDHSGGAERLRSATGAKVYAGAGDALALEAGEPPEAFVSTFNLPIHELHHTTVDVALKGDEDLRFGDVRIRALAMPGHTPGSMCYLMERQGLRVLFGGDVVMMLRGDDNPRSELRKPLGIYAAYLAPRYRGNAEDFLASLHRLRAMPAPDLVLPGHPRADSTPQSPALPKARWQAMLDSGIRDLEVLLARLKADGADFLDGDPKPLLPDLYYLGNFHGAAVYGLVWASKLYLFGPPGEVGIGEFVQAASRRLGLKPVTATVVLLTSSEPDQVAGLRELAGQSHLEIVAPAPHVGAIKNGWPAGTDVTSTDNLAATVRLPIRAISLGGRGLAPVAYELQWHGKSVLFTGTLATRFNLEAGERLVADLAKPEASFGRYIDSLARLKTAKPDVWLPRVPVDGQNANLYDDDWEQIIDENIARVQTNAVLKRGAD